ncbi:outer membrane beta-barrel protein [Winogradskyella pacifica]|uniref:outer membrane beta-barrel protein n=1 Tax=Winogradskyella pacifica TaxID=664642 RepID=UPI0015C6C288|nr:outer membrane beta-barrel protein [Winogradskyella pacifica]
MKYLFIFIFILFSNKVYLQTAKPTFFGAKIGYNNSNISGETTDGEKSGYLGNEFYIGLFTETQLTTKINLQTELIYSFTEDYSFLEVPITIKYNVYKKLQVFLGPKLDFLLDNDDDVFESNYKFKNFGISADFGAQYPISKRFFAEARYSIGFTEQLTQDIQLDINNAKRNTFRIGVGYRF